MIKFPFLPVVLVLFLTAVMGVGVIELLNQVSILGINIPQDDLTTDYLKGVLWATAIGLSIPLWPVPSQDKTGLVFAWLMKCLVTLVFMLAYEANYVFLDAYSYFEASKEGIDWETIGLGDGTANVVALASIHQYVIPNSYHAMKVSFSLIGLAGIYMSYRSAVFYLEKENIRILYALALFPSILFWSSILGKDPIVLLGICLYVFGVTGWHRRRQRRYILFLALGVLIASMMRLWLGPVLLAPLTVFVILNTRGVATRLTLAALASGSMVAVMSQVLSKFAIESSQDIVDTTDTISRGWASGGSAQEVAFEFTGVGTMIAFVPLGAFTALFRPLPGEVLNAFGLFAGLENLGLLFLLALAIKRTRLREYGDPIILWAIILVTTWACLYGFVSFQNLGSAVRFKLQVLPVLVCLLLYLSRRRSLLATTLGADARSAEPGRASP